MGTVVLKYDKNNSQEDYTYMAKSCETGEYIVGCIAIDKPWYSNPKDWTYYIIRNEYGFSGGFCGGSLNLGLKKYAVIKSTIEPFTQTANIKLNQARGISTELVESTLVNYAKGETEKVIAIINPQDEIPMELFENV